MSVDRTRSVTRSPGRVSSAARRASIYSKSGGYITPGIRRKTPVDDMTKRGVVVCQESGGELYPAETTQGVTTKYGQSVYLGHSTVPLNLSRTHFWRAFTKALMRAIGINIEDFNDFLIGSTIGVEFYFKLYPNDPPGSHAFTFAPLVKTYENMAQEFSQYFIGNNNESLYFQKVHVVVANQPDKQFDLSKAKMEYYCKSSLKMQNQTVNTTADDNSDDVNNVPLYGKSYEGTGNGAFYIKDYNNKNFIGRQSDGLIIYQPDAVTAAGTPNDFALGEPQSYKLFKYAKKSGKIHLDAGQLKTSVLTFQKNMGFSAMWRNIDQDTFEQSTAWTTMGNFRFFGVEKMMQFITTTSTNRIHLAYEVDNKIGMVCTLPKYTPTTMVLTNNPV